MVNFAWSGHEICFNVSSCLFHVIFRLCKCIVPVLRFGVTCYIDQCFCTACIAGQYYRNLGSVYYECFFTQMIPSAYGFFVWLVLSMDFLFYLLNVYICSRMCLSRKLLNWLTNKVYAIFEFSLFTK